MNAQFVDISSFQGAIDWVAYREWAASFDGIARVAMKATEGVAFTDPQFAANRQGALAAGIDMIFYYHFARPDLGNTPIAEANWCYKVIGGIRASDQIILDYEVQGDWAYDSWALIWLASVEGYYGMLPGIYASTSYIQARLQSTALAKYPLWLAQWQFTPDERPPAPLPWSSYEFVQYTDTATNIPGIGGSVDCNVFIGGATPVQPYSPNSGDFANWFTVDANGNWVAKGYNNPVIMGANLALYASLSTDGNTLPLIGLPRTSELYQRDPDGYQWSVQFFERGVIVYDPQLKKDGEPGMGASYIGKPLQFLMLDPDYKLAVTPPLDPKLVTAITAIRDDVEAVMRVAGLQ